MTKPSLHFEALRRMAETASGLRYTDTYFVFKEIEGELNIMVSDQPVPETDDTTVIASTGWEKPALPSVTTAVIGSGAKELNLLDLDVGEQPLQGDPAVKGVAADAVFLSASAVEKFLTPYYASVFGDRAGEIVSNLVGLFVPPWSKERGGRGTAPVGDVDHVFAVVHLPSSEYAAQSTLDTDVGYTLATVPSLALYGIHESGKVKKILLHKQP